MKRFLKKFSAVMISAMLILPANVAVVADAVPESASSASSSVTSDTAAEPESKVSASPEAELASELSESSEPSEAPIPSTSPESEPEPSSEPSPEVVAESENSEASQTVSSEAESSEQEEEAIVTIGDPVYFDPFDKTHLTGISSLISLGSVYNGNYRSELSSEQQRMYDKFSADYYNSTNQTPFIIDDGNSVFEYYFSSAITWTAGSESSKNAAVNRAFEDIRYAYFAFVYDHPQVYWASGISMQLLGGDTSITATRIYFYEKYDGAVNSIAYYESGVSSAVQQINSDITSDGAYATLRAIHDYLAERLSYNYNFNDYAFSGGGIFADGYTSVVCEGYGEAFKILCDKFSIPCAEIIGVANSGESHMWNYVLLKNKWYAVDVTWDDGDTVDYTYFLAGANTPGFYSTFSREHIEKNNAFIDTDDELEQITLHFPVLNDTAYPTTPLQISGVTFSGAEYNFDRLSHSLAISGTLPEGIKVKYSGNNQINAGTYKVTARFYDPTGTYDPQPSTMTATLKINPLSINELSVADIQNIEYSGTAVTIYPTFIGNSITPWNDEYSISYENNNDIGTAKATISGEKNFYGSIVKYFEITAPVILPPASLEIIGVNYNTLKFKWPYSASYKTNTYKIYQAESENGEYKLIKTIASQDGCEVNISGLNADKLYYYKISAAAVYGDKTFESAATVPVSAKPYMFVPSLRSDERYPFEIKVLWSTVDDVTGYELWMSVDGKSYKNIFISNTSNTIGYYCDNLEPNTQYYFKVKSYMIENGKGYYSEFSEPLSVRTKDLFVPELHVDDKSMTSVRLSCTEDLDATGYELWMSTDNRTYRNISVTNSYADYTWTVDDLNRGTQYYFKVKSYKFRGGKEYYGAFSAPLSVKTDDLSVPVLSVTGMSASEITVGWTKANGVTGYELWMSTDNRTYRNILVTNNMNSTTWKRTGLDPNTQYYFKIKSYLITNGRGYYGAFSEPLSVKTDNLPVPTLTAGKTTSALITTDWTRADGVTGYELWMSTDNKSYRNVLVTNNNTTVSKANGGLTPNTQYYFKIKSYLIKNGRGYYGAFSEPLSVKTTAITAPVLSVTSKSCSQIGIGWVKTYGVTGYELWMSTDNKTYKNVLVTKKNTILSNVTAGLVPNTQYYFKIKSYTISGGRGYYGAFSEPISVKSDSLPVPTVSFGSGTATRQTVSWTKAEGVRGYELWMSTDGKTYRNVTVTNSNNIVSYNVTGLKSKTKYYFKVKSYYINAGRGYYGSFSPVATVTTE